MRALTIEDRNLVTLTASEASSTSSPFRSPGGSGPIHLDVAKMSA
jgi:hypothetical protein